MVGCISFPELLLLSVVIANIQTNVAMLKSLISKYGDQMSVKLASQEGIPRLSLVALLRILIDRT